MKSCVCVLNSDWSAVQTPTARFRRPVEDEHVRLVGCRIEKKRQYQTETYPTGDTDRDRARYMFENVLTLLSQNIINKVLCTTKRKMHFNLFADHCLLSIFPFFRLNCVVFTLTFISMVATVYFLSSSIVHVPHSCFLTSFFFLNQLN